MQGQTFDEGPIKNAFKITMPQCLKGDCVVATCQTCKFFPRLFWMRKVFPKLKTTDEF